MRVPCSAKSFSAGDSHAGGDSRATSLDEDVQDHHQETGGKGWAQRLRRCFTQEPPQRRRCIQQVFRKEAQLKWVFVNVWHSSAYATQRDPFRPIAPPRAKIHPKLREVDDSWYGVSELGSRRRRQIHRHRCRFHKPKTPVLRFRILRVRNHVWGVQFPSIWLVSTTTSRQTPPPPLLQQVQEAHKHKPRTFSFPKPKLVVRDERKNTEGVGEGGVILFGHETTPF